MKKSYLKILFAVITILLLATVLVACGDPTPPKTIDPGKKPPVIIDPVKEFPEDWFQEGWEHKKGDADTYKGAIISSLDNAIKQTFDVNSTSEYVFPEQLSVTGALTFSLQDWKECILDFEISLNQTDISKTTAYLRFMKKGDSAPTFTVYYENYTLYITYLGQNFKIESDQNAWLDLDALLSGNMGGLKIKTADMGKILSLGLGAVLRTVAGEQGFYQKKDSIATEMYLVKMDASQCFKTLVTLFSGSESGGLVDVLFPANSTDPVKAAKNAKTRATLQNIAEVINAIDFSGVQFNMEATIVSGVLKSLTFPITIKDTEGEVVTESQFGFKNLTIKKSEIAVTKPDVALTNFVPYQNIVFDTSINLNIGSGSNVKTYVADIKFKLDDVNHLNNAMAINIKDPDNNTVVKANLLNNVIYADISKLLPSVIDFTGYNIGYIKYDLTEAIQNIIDKRAAESENAEEPTEDTTESGLSLDFGLIAKAILKAVDIKGSSFGMLIDQEVLEALTGIKVEDMGVALSDWLGMDVDVFLTKAMGFSLEEILNDSSIGMYLSFADKQLSLPLVLNGEDKGSLTLKLNGISKDASALALSSSEIAKYSELALPEWINVSVNGEMELSTTNTENAQGAIVNLLKNLLATANQGNVDAILTDTSLKVGVRVKIIYNSIDETKTKGMLDIYFNVGNLEESNIYIYYENNQLLVDFSEQGLPKFKYDIDIANFKEEMLPGIIRELLNTDTETAPQAVDGPSAIGDEIAQNTLVGLIARLLNTEASDVTWVPLLIETLVNSSLDSENGVAELTLSSALMQDLFSRLNFNFENPLNIRLEYGTGEEDPMISRLLLTTTISDKTVIGTGAPTETLSLDFSGFDLKFTDSTESWITSLNADEYFDLKYVSNTTDLARMLYNVFSPSFTFSYKLGNNLTDIYVQRAFFSVSETDPFYTKEYNNTYMLKATIKNVITADNPQTLEINEYTAEHLAYVWFDGENLIFDARNSEVDAFSAIGDSVTGAYFDVNLALKLFHYNWEGGDFAIAPINGESYSFDFKTIFNSLAFTLTGGNFDMVGGISTTEFNTIMSRLDEGLRRATGAVGTLPTDEGYETTEDAFVRFFTSFIKGKGFDEFTDENLALAISDLYNRFLNLNGITYDNIGLDITIDNFKIGKLNLSCAINGGGSNYIDISAEDNTWITIIPFEEIEQAWNMPKYTEGDKIGQYIMDENRLSYTYDSKGNISSIVEWDISGTLPKIAYIWINPISPDYSALSRYVKLKFIVPLEGGGTEVRYAHSYFDWNYDNVNLLVPTPSNASEPYSVTASIYGTDYTVYVRVLDVSSNNVYNTYFDMTGTNSANYRDIVVNDAIRVYIGSNANNTNYRTSFDKLLNGGTLPLSQTFYSITATGGSGTDGADFERGGSTSGDEGIDYLHYYDSLGGYDSGWSRCTIPVTVRFNNPYDTLSSKKVAMTFNEKDYNIVISLSGDTRSHPAVINVHTEIAGVAHTITRNITAYNGRYISLEKESTQTILTGINALGASGGGKIFLYEEVAFQAIVLPIINFTNSTAAISSVNSSNTGIVTTSASGEKQWLSVQSFNTVSYGSYNENLTTLVNNHLPGATGKNYRVYVSTLTISPNAIALSSKNASMVNMESATYSFCVAVPASVWNA